MSTENDVARSLRSWLRESRYEDADRVLDAVFDQVPATPQRRTFWLARRIPPMNTSLRIAMAIAAVVVLAIFGISFLLPSNVGDITPTITATPAATSSSTPSVPPLPKSGELSPGRYAIDVPASTVKALVTIGEGWSSGDYFLMDPPAFSRQISFWTVGNVYDDICDIDSGGLPTASNLPSPAVGPTVDDLVSALDAQLNTDMSPPVDVDVGGYAGKRVTMIISDPYADYCLGDDEFRPMWVDPEGAPQRGLQPGSPDTIWIVDVDGQRVVIVTALASLDDSEARARVAEVMDSIEFVLP